MGQKRAKAGTSKRAAAARKAAFVEALIANGHNLTKAAAAVGYKPGRAAEQAGWRLSKDIVVNELLAKRLAEGLSKKKLTADEVMASAARDLRFDPVKMYKADGSMKPIPKMDEDTRRALRTHEYDAKGRPKVRFPDQTAVREQLMKHFGLFEKDNAQKPQLPPPAYIIMPVKTKQK